MLQIHTFINNNTYYKVGERQNRKNRKITDYFLKILHTLMVIRERKLTSLQICFNWEIKEGLELDQIRGVPEQKARIIQYLFDRYYDWLKHSVGALLIWSNKLFSIACK